MKPTTLLAHCTTPDGRPMRLQEHDGEFFLKVDGVTLMSTVATASEEKMARLACERNPSRVLIGGLGFGFTLRQVLGLVGTKATVVVAELLPEIIAWNRQFLAHANGGCLADDRVEMHVGDVGDCLRAGSGGKFEAILLDVDNGADGLVDAGNNRLYSRRGLRMIKSALSPEGRAVFWSANRDKSFARALEREFSVVGSVGAKAYPQARRFSHTLFVADR